MTALKRLLGERRLVVGIFAVVCAGVIPAANAAGPSATEVVDALNAVFGKHKARAAHAKGQCVAGTFTPAAGIADVTRSASFAKSSPVLGRFSMGGGNPRIPDATKGAPRAFAFRVDPDGKSSDFAFISAPVHFAKAPAQMKAFLEVRVPGPDGKPDAEKIKAFTAANPNTAIQGKWLAEHPVPASYAGVSYWGVHAFTLTDAKGTARVAKLKLMPAAGDRSLTDDEAKAKPADFYVAELQEQLAKGSVAFKLVAILGEAGDPTDDITAMWPEASRKTVDIGTIAVTKIEDNARCDAGIFDPTQLADGIAGPDNDPMFAIRSEAYAVSLSRRAN